MAECGSDSLNLPSCPERSASGRDEKDETIKSAETPRREKLFRELLCLEKDIFQLSLFV